MLPNPKSTGPNPSTQFTSLSIPPSQSKPDVHKLPYSTQNAIVSPGLSTFRHANAELRTELNFSSQWDDDDVFNGLPSPQDNIFEPVSPEEANTMLARLRSIDDEVLGEEAYSSPNPRGSGDIFANHFQALSLSPTNKTRPNVPHSLHALSSSYITHTVAINIKEKADPRDIFGIETHLPWVKRLSPTRFSQPMNPRSSPPAVKSFWDAEDDEFDRWPTVQQAREELSTIHRKATLKRNTFVPTPKIEQTITEQVADAMNTPIGDTSRTAEEHEQLILELEDMDCGNPWGRDAHDDIVSRFRSRAYSMLPADAPARHMHVLDANAYVASNDPIIKAARPRLCDAVATILAYTSRECLEAFLDPKIQVFEWRRLGNCVMIRREGNKVLVGNYYNFGSQYQWGYHVRSLIDTDGAWSETYGSVSQGTTPVTKERVLFEQFEAEDSGCDVEPENEEFALYVGRELANFLLRWSVWDYGKWWRYKVEWEADGVVTNARDHYRYPVGLLHRGE